MINMTPDLVLSYLNCHNIDNAPFLEIQHRIREGYMEMIAEDCLCRWYYVKVTEDTRCIQYHFIPTDRCVKTITLSKRFKIGKEPGKYV